MLLTYVRLVLADDFHSDETDEQMRLLVQLKETQAYESLSRIEKSQMSAVV